MPAPRRLTLRESQAEVVRLSGEEAAALADLGRRLAGQQSWWGSDSTTETTAPSAVTVTPASAGHWRVRVNDAVGLLAVDDLHIEVRPKIPDAHLLGLLQLGEGVPRIDSDDAMFRPGSSLWDLLVRWYLSSVETVLRAGLMRDYRETYGDLQVVRGRLDATRAVVNLSRGTITLPCQYEEFDENNALNRVLLAGVRAVLAAPVVSAVSRRSARRLAMRFEDVGRLQPPDLEAAVTDRRTAHYETSLQLARLLLTGQAASLAHGGTRAWGFLFRTPEAVEAGLRKLLGSCLVGHSVVKKKKMLHGSTKTLNPDLVFGYDLAVGDVKYKLQSSEWANDDLYQLVTFATGFRVTNGLLLSFSEGLLASSLQVGDVRVVNLGWDARPEVSFEASATKLVRDVQGWLDVVQASTLSVSV